MTTIHPSGIPIHALPPRCDCLKDWHPAVGELVTTILGPRGTVAGYLPSAQLVEVLVDRPHGDPFAEAFPIASVQPERGHVDHCLSLWLDMTDAPAELPSVMATAQVPTVFACRIEESPDILAEDPHAAFLLAEYERERARSTVAAVSAAVRLRYAPEVDKAKESIRASASASAALPHVDFGATTKRRCSDDGCTMPLGHAGNCHGAMYLVANSTLPCPSRDCIGRHSHEGRHCDASGMRWVSDNSAEVAAAKASHRLEWLARVVVTLRWTEGIGKRRVQRSCVRIGTLHGFDNGAPLLSVDVPGVGVVQCKRVDVRDVMA